MRIIDREEVAQRLTYELAIPIVREAMIAFSTGQTRQLLRSIIPMIRMAMKNAAMVLKTTISHRIG